MNLTRVPREECRLRHFVDSLLFADLIPLGATVLDVGSGPGLPAWPLACARPDLQITALDSSGKMMGFLSKNLLPNLRVCLARAEEWGRREEFDFVTGRAVAPLGIQLELSAAPCLIGGFVAPLRSVHDQFDLEVRRLGLALDRVVERILPGTDIRRACPVYRKVAATPLRYPRTWVEIRREPLT